MYVISGTLHVEQNGHHILKAGDGIVMRLIDKHKYYTDGKDICEILWMHFAGLHCDDLLNLIDDTATLPAIFKLSVIENIIKNCFTLINTNNSDVEFLISQEIYRALPTITNFVCKKAQMVEPQIEFKNKANQFVDNHIYNTITLKSFADDFSISQYHFCRKFRRYFNLTPMQFVLTKKIEMSKYLLTYTNESLSSIAISLGFADQSHFSKAFKRLQNKSPTDFRKKINNLTTFTPLNLFLK